MPCPVRTVATSAFVGHSRHKDGFGQIQQLRTIQLLERFIPVSGLKIADIGGATGPYAFHFAKQGHHVELIDLVPTHIDQAKKLAEEKGISLAGFTVVDARDLPLENNSLDIVIIHGPLYHIQSEQERIAALKEAKRVLKPSGLLFAFAINRYAGVFYGLHTGLMADDAYFDMVSTEVKTGIREREPGWYFHLPSELTAEVQAAGFEIQALKSVAGQSWMLPDAEQRLSESAFVDKVMAISELLEDEVHIGQDILCVGIRP